VDVAIKQSTAKVRRNILDAGMFSLASRNYNQETGCESSVLSILMH
jgi:hypothetical protein